MTPSGFQVDYSTYNLQPTIFISLSHILSTSPPNQASQQKLSSYIKQELTHLVTSYKEIKSGHESKYYVSFHSRVSSLVKLSVTLWTAGDNWEDLLETLIEVFEIKLKISLDSFQFGIKIESMSVLSDFVSKNISCRFVYCCCCCLWILLEYKTTFSSEMCQTIQLVYQFVY